MKIKKIIGIALIIIYFTILLVYAYTEIGNEVFILLAKIFGLITFSFIVGWLLVSGKN